MNMYKAASAGYTLESSKHVNVKSILTRVISHIIDEYEIEHTKSSRLLLGETKDCVITVDYLFTLGENKDCDYFLCNHIVGLNYTGKLDKFLNLTYSLNNLRFLVDVELFRDIYSCELDKDLYRFIKQVRCPLIIQTDKFKYKNKLKVLTIDCNYLAGVNVNISYFREIRVTGAISSGCYKDFMINTGKSCRKVYIIVKNVGSAKECLNSIRKYGNTTQTVVLILEIAKILTLMSKHTVEVSKFLKMRKEGYKIKFHLKNKHYSDTRCAKLVLLVSRLENTSNYYDTYLSLFNPEDCILTKEALNVKLSSNSMREEVENLVCHLNTKLTESK